MGGPSGAVQYPTYISNAHKEFLGDPTAGDTLTDNALTITEDILTLVTNPYLGQSPYDPTTELAGIQTEITTYKNLVTALDEITTWEAMVAAAEGQIDTLVPSTTELENEVQAFSDGALIDLARSINRSDAAYHDINAVIGTAFWGDRAILELSFATEVRKFRYARTSDRSRERLQAYLSSISAMSNLLATKFQAASVGAQLQDTVAKAKIAAFNNEISQEIELRVNEAKWDLEILQQGSRVIGATAGIPGMSKGMSEWQMKLMTISTFASIGTSMLGAVTGGMGNMMGMIPFLMG